MSNLPERWPSEAEEMRDQAQAWTARMADRAQTLAAEIADALDKLATEWREDQLLEVEEMHYELLVLRNRCVQYGWLDPAKARGQ